MSSKLNNVPPPTGNRSTTHPVAPEATTNDDLQPNERIISRRVANPPMIRSSVPLPRSRSFRKGLQKGSQNMHKFPNGMSGLNATANSMQDVHSQFGGVRLHPSPVPAQRPDSRTHRNASSSRIPEISSNGAQSVADAINSLATPKKKRRLSAGQFSASPSAAIPRGSHKHLSPLPSASRSPSTSLPPRGTQETRQGSFTEPLDAHGLNVKWHPRVKRERSTSPTLSASDNGPRQVSEGSIRIAPLPANCQNSNSQFKLNRKLWAEGEVANLRSKGLQVARVFIREDGMVIDWHSRVPVMSDTLLPATLAQVQNPPSNVLPFAENDTQRYPAPAKQPTAWPKPAVEVIDVDAIDTSVVPNAAWTAVQRPTPPPSCRAGSASTPVNSSDPPRSGSHSIPPEASRHAAAANFHTSASPRRLSRPLPRRPRPKVNPVAVDPVTDITSPSFNSTVGPDTELPPDVSLSLNLPPVDEHPEFYSSGANRGGASLLSLSKPNSVSAETDSQTSDPSASLGASALIPIPQTDAVALESAALVFLERFVLAFDADRATLAPAYSHCATISVRTPQEAGGLKQGRLAIAAALLALPDSLRFCAAGKAHIDYDVAYLGPQVGVLLVCYSHGHTTGQHKWSCEQALVLRRKEWDEEDRDTEGLWPLVAVCHRIHIRGSE